VAGPLGFEPKIFGLEGRRAFWDGTIQAAPRTREFSYIIVEYSFIYSCLSYEFWNILTEIHYERTARGFEAICTINPRVLQHEMEKKVESEKLTTVNICLRF
jgi:hypothetical protein